MDHESGDDYVLKTAKLIRIHEQRLAEAGFIRRGRPLPTASAFNMLSWIGLDGGPAQRPTAKPLVLSMDTHHLFYLLMRFEALELPVGPLDLHFDTGFRPTSYISVGVKDRSDTLSISSFRSTFSAVSNLSLGSGWWGRPEPPKPDAEVKYLYSAFTKLPALSLHKPAGKMIQELVFDPPNDSAVPLDVFKNLQSLECVEIDPTTLLAWDQLSTSLRTLTIKRSGVEDFTDIFVDSVVDDQLRRQGRPGLGRRRKLREGRNPTLRKRPATLNAKAVPASIPEDAEETPSAHTADEPGPERVLSSLSWAFLKHLCLADNALTFFPTAPLSHLTSLTHLDLSSNLLVSVPAGLEQLYNLVSLNLADNMIESVLGIYTQMGQVLNLNLSRNRLDSLCGLERLAALERIDLRGNRIDESAEVGRLSLLPNISEVWIVDNPLVKAEPEYRVRCFEYFAREGKEILLDGSAPGFYERRQLTTRPPEEPKRMAVAPSPPVVAVGAPAPPSPVVSAAVGIASPVHPTSPSAAASSPTSQRNSPAVPSKPRARKHKRIVNLDSGDQSGTDESARTEPHARHVRTHNRAASHDANAAETDTLGALPAPSPREGAARGSMTLGRHSRFGTDAFAPGPLLPGMRVPPAGGSISKSARRRARVSASVYEPGVNVAAGSPPSASDADAFRAKIDALRNEVGDSWLKVLGQTQLAGDTSPRSGGATPSPDSRKDSASPPL